jgi:hypothetical protein
MYFIFVDAKINLYIYIKVGSVTQITVPAVIALRTGRVSSRISWVPTQMHTWHGAMTLHIARLKIVITSTMAIMVIRFALLMSLVRIPFF